MRKLLQLNTLFLVSLLALCALSAAAQQNEEHRAWNRPVKPFRVAGNIYYVGVAGVTSFLITTPAGHILLDGGFAETVPHIQESIAQLGFKLQDVKVLLNSHAHFDHAGGLARLKELSGAKLMIMKGDAELINGGGKGDFYWGDKPTFKPAKVDRVLHDRETIELGGIRMTARLTPGHTKGNTTWLMKVREDGRELDVVFVGSMSVPGYKLLDTPLYPNMVADYASSFALLKSLKCDLFLAPHGQFFDLDKKMQQLEKGGKPNPFIDPQGYQDFLSRMEKAYQQQLEKERQAKTGGKRSA